jgi:ketosteroid isomerase-like protein
MEFQDPEGNPVVIDGKFMTIGKKQADGGWRVAVDMFNANGPPPAGE